MTLPAHLTDNQPITGHLPAGHAPLTQLCHHQHQPPLTSVPMTTTSPTPSPHCLRDCCLGNITTKHQKTGCFDDDNNDDEEDDSAVARTGAVQTTAQFKTTFSTMPSVRPFCAWKWRIAFNFKCFFAFFFKCFSSSSEPFTCSLTTSLPALTTSQGTWLTVCVCVWLRSNLWILTVIIITVVIIMILCEKI